MSYTKNMSHNTPSGSDIIANPFYAVNISEHLFNAPEPRVSEEDWVILNANLAKDIGNKAWLEEFLDIMSQSHSEYNGHDIINPTLVVTLSGKLRGKHDTLVSRDEWVAANDKLIEEAGAARWLQNLLIVLTSDEK